MRTPASRAFSAIVFLLFSLGQPLLAAQSTGTAVGVLLKEQPLGLDLQFIKASSSRSQDGNSTDQAQLAEPTLEGVAPDTISVQAIQSRTESVYSAAGAITRQTSRVDLVNLNLLNGLVRASLVRAVAVTDANGFISNNSTNGSQLVDLVVNGVPIANATPNTRIDLPAQLFGPDSYVMLFEVVRTTQSPAGLSGGTYLSDLAVNMIRVKITDKSPLITGNQSTEIVVGQAVARSEHPQAPAVQISVNDVSVVEQHTGEANAVFTVSLSRTNHVPVTVSFATANGTATAPLDYRSVSGTLTFDPFTLTRTVNVPVLGDLLYEKNEDFQLVLSNPTQAVLGKGIGIGTIIDDELPPEFSINDVTVTESDSGNVAAVFTVTLSAVSGVEARVNFSTANVTATAGADYEPLTGTLVFPPGTTAMPVQVTVLPDLVDEINETFHVQLASPVNAGMADPQGVGTILDNDPPPSLAINDVVVTERDSGVTNAQFTVTLSSVSSLPVTVPWSTQNESALAGEDYSAASGTLTFPPGTTALPLQVAVLSDLLSEATESFVVRLGSPVNATLADDTGRGTILDNDPLPALTIRDVTVTEPVNSDTPLSVTALFEVTLSTPSGQPVSVKYATANGTAVEGLDYSAASGILQFPAGVTSRTIAVPVWGDLLDEADEDFLVRLAEPSNAVIADPEGRGLILDNDAPPSVGINDVAVREGHSGGVPATFQVTLSHPSGLPVEVQFGTANGTAMAGADYQAAAGTVSFAPGETQKTVRVIVLGDEIYEGNETFSVILSHPVHAVLGDEEGIGLIEDDDTAPEIRVEDVRVQEGNPAVFRITLNRQSGLPVTVAYATAPGSAAAGTDFQPASGQLVFPPGESVRTVSVSTVQDSEDEPDEHFFLTLSSPSGGVLADGEGEAVILDDDEAPSLSINDVSVEEPDSGSVRVAFTVSLSARSGKTVQVDFSTRNGSAHAGSDYLAASGRLTLEPGKTSALVEVEIRGDLLHEANEDFAVILSNASHASLADPQGICVIVDNDAPPQLTLEDVTVTEPDEGTREVQVRAVLSAESALPATVEFSTAEATAVHGADFVGRSGTLLFPPGSTSQIIRLEIVGDRLNEATEFFRVELRNGSHLRIADPEGVVTILDNDPVPGIRIQDAVVTELDQAEAIITFHVSLSAASGQTVTVEYATADGSALAPADYTARSGLLSFAPGVVTLPVTVAVQGDLLDEADETFFVHLSNPVHAVIDRSPGEGIILDNDATPALQISDATPVVEGLAAAFEVTLSAPSGQTVTVDWSTRGGTARPDHDFRAASGRLVFAPGVTRLPVVITTLDDDLFETTEQFSVVLQNPAKALLSDADGLGTILDNEPAPRVTVDDVTLREGNSGSTPAVFVFHLSGRSELPVSVQYATRPGTATAELDFASASGTLTFAPGAVSAQAAVPVFGDLLDEPDETFLLVLSDAVNGVLEEESAVALILDDDEPPVLSLQDVTVRENDEGVTNALFVATLSAPSGYPVTASYSARDLSATLGRDYRLTGSEVVFPPGTVVQQIVVEVLGDRIHESAEQFELVLENLQNAVAGDPVGLGTILDNDAAPVFTVNDVSVEEPDSGSVPAQFTIQLTGATEVPASVWVATANGTATAPADYAAVEPVLLEFAPGETRRELVVLVRGDAVRESTEHFLVLLTQPADASVGDGEGRGTILDNDPLPLISINSVSVLESNEGTQAVFTVRLSTRSDLAVGVDYRTANVSALAGMDYVATSGRLEFAPGQTELPVRVPVIGDLLDEPDEEFLVHLENAVEGAVHPQEGTGRGTILDDDDAPGIRINDVTVIEPDSGTAPAGFTVSLTAPSAFQIQVSYATQNGTAHAGVDYTAGSGRLTFAPGVTSLPLQIPVLGDTLNEPNETFRVVLSDPSHATLADPEGEALIVDNDGLPLLSINHVTVPEGEGPARFLVTLSAASGQPVSVRYATENGSATAPEDYATSQGLLNFPPGVVSLPVEVPVREDLVDEPDEHFHVVLSDPVNAGIANGRGQGTILDNDEGPALAITDVTVEEPDEGSVTAVFSVSLGAVSAQTVTVHYEIVGGTAEADRDFLAAQGILTFPPGTVLRLVSVPVLGDRIDEIDETFRVVLSQPVHATLPDPEGLGTILDNDEGPEIRVTGVRVTEGHEGTTPAVFQITLSAPSGVPVQLEAETADGTALGESDYIPSVFQVTFPPGVVQQTVEVPVIGDRLDELDEHFVLLLRKAANGTLAQTEVRGEILDDDQPVELTVGDAEVVEGDEGETPAHFRVVLSAPSGLEVRFSWTTRGSSATEGVDYRGAAGAAVIPAGATELVLPVYVFGDRLKEFNESFRVEISEVQNAVGVDLLGVGTILDDDVPPLLAIGDVVVEEPAVGAVAAALKVRLSAASGQPVSVRYATQDGTARAGLDYTVTSGVLHFPPGSTEQVITVPIHADSLDEPDEELWVVLSDPVHAGEGDFEGRVLILDSNEAPSLSILDVVVQERHEGFTEAVFSVRLSAASSQPVEVQFATQNGSAVHPQDYLPASGTLRFEPGVTEQAVVVLVAGDLLDEPDEVFSVLLSAPVNAVIADPEGQGLILDDDDEPRLAIEDAKVAEPAEGELPLAVRVRLSAPSGREVRVQFQTADGTALQGHDYRAASGLLQFPPGTTEQLVHLVVLADGLDEFDETFLVNLSQPVNARIDDAQGAVHIIDVDAEPGVRVEGVSVEEGNSGLTPARFTVSLTRPSGKPVLVDYVTLEGTARAGSDFLLAGGSITLPPGAHSGSVVVMVIGETFYEADESFHLQLQRAENGVIETAQAAGIILNDDLIPALTISDQELLEPDIGHSDAVFTVALSNPGSEQIRVRFATRPGTAQEGADYRAATGELVFEPGEVMKQVIVQVIGDTLNEQTETFFVDLIDPQGAVLADPEGLGRILDNDTMFLAVGDCEIAEGDEGLRDAVFTVTLSLPSDQVVEVEWYTTDITAKSGIDYQASSGRLVFEPGVTSRTLTVPIIGDLLWELDEFFYVNLVHPVNAVVHDPQGLGTIINDEEQPRLTINDVTVIEGNSGHTLAVFTVRLSEPAGETVSVRYETRDGTALQPQDYVAASGQIQFAPGVTEQFVTIQVVADSQPEPTEHFLVRLLDPVHAAILDGEGRGEILDEDNGKTDLQVAMTALPVSTDIGCEIVYSIHVKNAGANTATGVALLDLLPPGALVSSSSPPDWVSLPGRNLRYSIGDLAPGASRQVSLVLIPSAGAREQFKNQVEAVATEPDATPDDNKASAITTVNLKLPFTASNVTTNRQTTLYDQDVWVTNTGCSLLAGVRVRVTGLTNGITLHNAWGVDETGAQFVQSMLPVEPGGVVRFRLEYAAPHAGVATPKLEAYIGSDFEPLPVPSGRSLTATEDGFRVSTRPNGARLLRWVAVPGRRYTIIYSNDPAQGTPLVVVRPSVSTQGDTIFWIDEGMPKTESHPSLHPNRFYWVVENP